MYDAQDTDYILDGNGHEIYRYGYVYSFNGEELCEDCFKEKIESLLKDNPLYIAELLGLNTAENITCGHEIYAGEKAIILKGQRLCPDCFREHIESLLWNDPAFMAEMLNGEVKEIA